MRRLSALRISAPAVIVNAVGAGTCSFCVATKRAQRSELRALAADVRRRGRAVTIAIAPAEMPPPRGPAALRRWRATWRAAIRS
jgi:hypothetical protein